MWKRLMDMFITEGGQSERSVIRQRLSRKVPKIVFKTDAVEPATATQTSTGVHAVPASQLTEYWKDRTYVPTVSSFIQNAPQMREAISTSQNLLQPGSAEVFPLIRLHPADELKARREREAEARMSQSGRFIKSGKFQRIA